MPEDSTARYRVQFPLWIKHASELARAEAPIIDIDESGMRVRAHPHHDAIHLSRADDSLDRVRGLDKTLQLYFFGFAWATVVDWADPVQRGVTEEILRGILPRLVREETRKKWDMPWDDHAISERASSLVRLLEANVLEGDLAGAVRSHLVVLEDALNGFLASRHWLGNNHRVFHHIALLDILVSRGAPATRIAQVSNSLLDTVAGLIDVETGVALEESISYAYHDMDLLRRLEQSLGRLGLAFDGLSVKQIDRAFGRSMSALAYPDASLPASGDTILGLTLPASHRRVVLERADRLEVWRSLDRLGYTRLACPTDDLQALVLTHSAQAAHGHVSPLHIELWCARDGLILTDSGGPYRYGDPLRYRWFRAPAGHNTLNYAGWTTSDKHQVSLVPNVSRDAATGTWVFPSGTLQRGIRLADGELSVLDDVSCPGEWLLSFHLAPGVEVESLTQARKGLFVVTLGRSSKSEARFEGLAGSDIVAEMATTKRCVGHGQTVDAPSILVRGMGNVRVHSQIRTE